MSATTITALLTPAPSATPAPASSGTGGAAAFQGHLDAQSGQLSQPGRPERQDDRGPDSAVVDAAANAGPAGSVDAAPAASTTAAQAPGARRDQDEAPSAPDQAAVPAGLPVVPAFPLPFPLPLPVSALSTTEQPATTSASAPVTASASVPATAAMVPGPAVAGPPVMPAAATTAATDDRSAPATGAAMPAPGTPAAAAHRGASTASAAPAASAAPDAAGAPDAPAAATPTVPSASPAAMQSAGDAAAPSARAAAASDPSPAGAAAVLAAVAAPGGPLAGVRIRQASAPGAGGTTDDRKPAADATAATPTNTTPPIAAPTVLAPQSVAAPAPVSPVAPAQPTEPTLAAQLVPPIAALATRGDGEHVVTVRVTPENLGSVTVRAHVSAGDLRVELFAADPHARDAIAAMLPELRRDLTAGAPGTTTVGLGTGDATQSGARGSGSDREASPQGGRPAAAPSLAAPTPSVRSPWRAAPASGRLDVLA